MDDARRDEVEAQRAGDLADELRRIHDEEATLQARKLRLLAEAFALAEEQKARIPSKRSKERDMPLRALAAELGLAVRTNDRTMQSNMWDAHRLTTSFAATVVALDEGRISRGHVSAILDTGAALDDPMTRAAFEETVLDYAETTTPARTRAFAKQQADIHNPLTLQQRHDLAVQGRRIWVTDVDDSMSVLSQLLPTVIAHGILDRTTRQADLIKRTDAARRRAVLGPQDGTDAAATAASTSGDSGLGDPAVACSGTGGATDGDAASGEAGIPRAEVGDSVRDEAALGGRSYGDSAVGSGSDAGSGAGTVHDEDVWFDERTIDQIRADLVADMLLTGTPGIDPTLDATTGGLGAIRATVQITIPVTTLTGVTSSGAELDGVAPVDPETARRLAGAAPGWDRVMTHPVTGMVLAVDRYQPTAAQQRFLNARDQHCRFPGCRRPARRCHHDHTHDHARGGPTDVTNLACLCARHHTLKHATDWKVRQLPGGTLEWTSPAGRPYLDDPPRRVVFVPGDDSAAPF
ncbi:hypothetical protein GCM10025760_24050 [Microbacterium yannicii]|uniref:HNH nuclease domain-containing protein n=1 Tax=Microbacterium yannicii TaxID=671622 RepID=A0ABP9ME33_9MICO|nr:HNH endonuclease signature motif containing protein [Microbacterium yannicii]MCO5952786.1 HNH endonuclease [Microbacterium yannicii]